MVALLAVICYLLAMTTAVVATVQTAVSNQTRQVHVPIGLRGVSSILFKIRSIWHWYMKAEIYTNPKNFQSLVAGHILNVALGDNTVVRIAAQCILIAHRILECVNQTHNVARGYREWIDALTGNYGNLKREKWDKGLQGTEYKSCWNSFAEGVKSTFWSVVERIKRIAVTTFYMFKEVFVQTMMIMDAIEAFSMSPETRNESINELFVNGTKFLDNMAKKEQQELLVDCLYENKSLIGKVLKGIGSSMTVDQLIEKASAGSDALKTATRVADVAGDFLKRAISGFYSGIGETSKTPTWAKPDAKTPIEKEAASKKEAVSQEYFPISNATKKLQTKWKYGTI